MCVSPGRLENPAQLATHTDTRYPSNSVMSDLAPSYMSGVCVCGSFLPLTPSPEALQFGCLCLNFSGKRVSLKFLRGFILVNKMPRMGMKA